MDTLRTKRTNGTKTYTYSYIGNQLWYYKVNDQEVFITWDANGLPFSMTTGNSTYYYVTNLQGDVTALMNDAGAIVASYTYTPWGAEDWAAPTTGTIAHLNPLRYRGYVFDEETGLYYLQSRYYDPEIGRFINADNFVSTGQGILGNNMYAYCSNNPVLYIDYSGTRHEISAGGGGPLSASLVSGQLTYGTSYSPKGDLYEHWSDTNGKKVWSRHHTDHGYPKYHTNPHDHAWEDDDDGHNKPGPPLPPNPQFKTPQNHQSNNQSTNKMVGGMVGTVTITVVVYIGVKWAAAALFAPATGGGSLIVAAVAP